METNIKATFHSIPPQVIGPFKVTLQNFSSSGITFDSGKVNNINTITTPSSGTIDVLNIGPTETILKNDLTYNQLSTGYTFTNFNCGDTYLVFESLNVCNTTYTADIIGSTGYPKIKLTLNNNENTPVSSSLSVSQSGGPITTVKLNSATSGVTQNEIVLSKGSYTFNFGITGNTSSTAAVSFVQCDLL